jgi:hypothetical protein
MQRIFDEVEEFLRGEYFALVVYFIGLFGVLGSVSRLTDTSHEIGLVGYRWLYGGETLYTQVWSKYSPQTLALGAIYSKYFNSGAARFIFELVIYTATYLLLYKIFDLVASKTLRKPMLDSSKSVALLLATSILIVPGVWQSGVEPTKISLLLLCLSVYMYYKWRASKTSYWLLGATAKNWRYMLGFAVAATLLIHMTILNVIFVLPIVVDLVLFCKKTKLSILGWSSFWYSVLLVNFWVLYSIFSSHGLLVTALKMTWLGVSSQLNEAFVLASTKAIILLPIFVMAVHLILGAKQANFKDNPPLWVLSISILAITILAPGFALASLVLMLPFAALLMTDTTKKLFTNSQTAALLIISLAATIPSIYLYKSQNTLEHLRAQAASAYVQQRIVGGRYAYYYGVGAGFYGKYGLSNPTGFYDPTLFSANDNGLDLGGKFRGDNEANAPEFAVYATGDISKVPNSPARIEQYFTKHYTVAETLDDYKILKRK